MVGHQLAPRALRERSCREPQMLTNRIGNPLPMIITEKKFKAAARKLKALFACCATPAAP